jgi:transmembrane sensor
VTTPDLSSEDLRLEAAAAWHVRLAGDVGEKDWVAFTAWLEADPRNRQAFDAVDAVSAAVVANIPAGPSLVTAKPGWATKVARRVWVPVGLAAAVALGVFLTQHFQPPKTEQIATAIGEHKDIQLADGSTLHLNTNTVVDVTFGRNVRGARVEKGEALFEVAPDRARPFDVEVGDRRVHVVGTAFNILRHGGQIAVTVKHGTVQVSPTQSGMGEAGQKADGLRTMVSQQMVSLQPGDQYLGREGVAAYQIVKADASNVGAWQNGQLVFDDAPLSQVASDLSRYFARPVVVTDESVRNLRFSGVLKIDGQAAMLQRLAAFVPVSVHVAEDQVVLERGASK